MTNHELRCKKMTPTAVLPTRGRTGDAGLDLHADKRVIVFAGTQEMIGTGVAVAIPENHVGLVLGRSGLAHKDAISIMGGVIDSNYRGELRVIVRNNNPWVNVPSRNDWYVEPGDRIAQLVILPIAVLEPVLVDELDDTVRGDAGFGSSGA